MFLVISTLFHYYIFLFFTAEVSLTSEFMKLCKVLLNVHLWGFFPPKLFFTSFPPESTQLEDPRAQWQREQEAMLRDYLVVARDALSAQKEIYQVKEQRLRLAQQEYRQLNDAWKDKSTSQTSCEWWRWRLSWVQTEPLCTWLCVRDLWAPSGLWWW